MVSIIVQVSKYILLAIMVFFTLETYMVLQRRDEESRRRIMRKQIWLMVLFNVTSFLVLYLVSGDVSMIIMLGCVIIYILVVQILYRLIYQKASLILLNTMCMMLSIGFVIQSRLGMDTARKQFAIAAFATLVCFIIPVFVRRVRWVSNLTWVYGIGGIVLLAGVLLIGRVTGGAVLNVTIGGISFQFSEFVKITIVLFMAGMLQEKTDFRTVVITTVVAALHVGILALSADLGAALIYFVAYIVMVYVATRNPAYSVLGLLGMGAASALAYRLFNHVRVRVQIWRDPFADYEGTGYQIIQALFGVCAGGWFGTGLMNGHPDFIPLAWEDFTFAAICEEFGILFAICLIILCMGMYLLIVNISMRLSRPFYKLVAIGLGTEYAFQVFLTIGGTTKFIPMTGITLPLISYGGSSLSCTIIMISIIQGLYILRKDEDIEIEMARREARRQAALERRQKALREQRAQRTQRFRGAYTEDRTRQMNRREDPVQAQRNYVDPTEGYQDNNYGEQQWSEETELERRIEQQTRQDLALRNK